MLAIKFGGAILSANELFNLSNFVLRCRLVNQSATPFPRLCGVFLAVLCVSLAGCGANFTSNSSLAGGSLRANLHGGRQPISGARVHLYAAGSTGYGSIATAFSSSPSITAPIC